MYLFLCLGFSFSIFDESIATFLLKIFKNSKVPKAHFLYYIKLFQSYDYLLGMFLWLHMPGLHLAHLQ